MATQTQKEKRRERTDDVRAPKMRRQRQAMIQGAITRGVFRDRRDVKGWMKKEFKIDEPLDELSTEYSLTDKQLKLWYIWLRHFNGKGKKPRQHRSRSRAGDRKLWRIKELKKALGWTDSDVADFIEHQIGKRKIPQSLWADEAHKVITGMDRIKSEQPFKRKHELKN